MRNNNKTYNSEDILNLVSSLPYFTFDNLKVSSRSDHYLRMLAWRYSRSGKLIRFKRGVYTTKLYIDNLEKTGKTFSFLEFVANILYSPSYLSLEYILSKHNILTELPANFTSISTHKTNHFSNQLGNFIYHNIKNELFLGFKIFKKRGFLIYEATKPKAVFDFLYLRKNQINSKAFFEELRLNLSELKNSDYKELEEYILLEGSKKMKNILSFIK